MDRLEPKGYAERMLNAEADAAEAEPKTYKPISPILPQYMYTRPGGAMMQPELPIGEYKVLEERDEGWFKIHYNQQDVWIKPAQYKER